MSWGKKDMFYRMAFLSIVMWGFMTMEANSASVSGCCYWYFYPATAGSPIGNIIPDLTKCNSRPLAFESYRYLVDKPMEGSCNSRFFGVAAFPDSVFFETATVFCPVGTQGPYYAPYLGIDRFRLMLQGGVRPPTDMPFAVYTAPNGTGPMIAFVNQYGILDLYRCQAPSGGAVLAVKTGAATASFPAWVYRLVPDFSSATSGDLWVVGENGLVQHIKCTDKTVSFDPPALPLSQEVFTYWSDSLVCSMSGKIFNLRKGIPVQQAVGGPLFFVSKRIACGANGRFAIPWLDGTWKAFQSGTATYKYAYRKDNYEGKRAILVDSAWNVKNVLFEDLPTVIKDVSPALVREKLNKSSFLYADGSLEVSISVSDPENNDRPLGVVVRQAGKDTSLLPSGLQRAGYPCNLAGYSVSSNSVYRLKLSQGSVQCSVRINRPENYGMGCQWTGFQLVSTLKWNDGDTLKCFVDNNTLTIVNGVSTAITHRNTGSANRHLFTSPGKELFDNLGRNVAGKDRDARLPEPGGCGVFLEKVKGSVRVHIRLDRHDL